MTQQATVIKNMSGLSAIVRVRRKGACGQSCGRCHGCSAPNEIIEVKAVNRVNAKEGDLVLVESGTKETLKLAAVVYLLPIVLFFIGWLITPSLGAVGVVVGLGFTVLVNMLVTKKGGVQVHIIAIVNKAR